MRRRGVRGDRLEQGVARLSTCDRHLLVADRVAAALGAQRYRPRVGQDYINTTSRRLVKGSENRRPADLRVVDPHHDWTSGVAVPRTTTAEHGARADTSIPTEPLRRPVNPPKPRLPTTMDRRIALVEPVNTHQHGTLGLWSSPRCLPLTSTRHHVDLTVLLS